MAPSHPLQTLDSDDFASLAEMNPDCIIGHMDAPSDTKLSPFVGYISPWKVIGLTASVSALAVCPLLPGFSKGLVYTAFFYTKWGYPILVLSALIFFMLAILQLPLIFRAVVNRPAIEITAETVRIWGLKWREYPLSCVATGARRQFGSLLVRCPDRKQFTIPLWLYRNPQEVLIHLIPTSDGRQATALP